ncbi:hypothetical protein [Salipiger mucosus]|uniref:hypothetical protein n=1 Tax=Salipiger mucosus TaxID=263378 RepID=UPI0012EBD396|nr:hypothetical protein [Salipiger mucosus]
MKINTKRLKKQTSRKEKTTRENSPAAGAESRPSSAGRSPSPGSNTSVKDLPWFWLFKDRGYKDTAIPRDPPPRIKSYEKIEEWVTGGGWILDEDADLAMDIWLRRVDPLNYERQVTREPSKPARQASSSTQAPKTDPAGFSTGKKSKRFGKRRREREAAHGPSGP